MGLDPYDLGAPRRIESLRREPASRLSVEVLNDRIDDLNKRINGITEMAVETTETVNILLSAVKESAEVMNVLVSAVDGLKSIVAVLEKKINNGG